MSNPALDRAASYLVSTQDEDGFWRDYDLEPGRSEAWTTACVGFALCRIAGEGREVSKAAQALLDSCRPGGWGYNSRTACDADTTSWVIRFLAQAGQLGDVAASTLLNPYVSTSGRVRTFSSQSSFGTWAWEHDEVAPLTGMALIAAGEPQAASSIRRSVIESTWRPFWWRCTSYVSAQSLEFLSLSGGIPESIGRREAAQLDALTPPSSCLDLAHRVRAAALLGVPSRWTDTLLGLQGENGGWPGSPELLVPSQTDGSPGDPYTDDRGLMTTAMALLAIAG